MYPQDQIRKRRAMDERLPDGRTVAEALAALVGNGGGPLGGPVPTSTAALPPMPAPTGPQPLPAPLGTVPPPAPQNPVFMGTRTAGKNKLGILLDQSRELQGAGVSSKVSVTPEGVEVAPPAHPTETNSRGSRIKQALTGLLQGAVMGSQHGGWGALSGAATGAVAGGISPNLMQAFTRHQEIGETQTNIERELKNTLGTAQIAETQAQTQQRIAEAQMTDYTDPESGEIYPVPAKQVGALKERYRTGKALRDSRTADDKRADAALAETKRYHDAQLKRVKITVGGQEFEVSEDRAASIKQRQEADGAKPSPAREAVLLAELEEEAQDKHLYLRGLADKQAGELRQKRADIIAEKNPAYGSEADEFDLNRRRKIIDLDRQIAEAEKESAYRQKEGDDSATRKRAAQAKARANSGGRTIEGAIKAFTHDKGRAPTTEETARMQAALNR